MLKFKGLKNINEKKESKFINEGIISKSIYKEENNSEDIKDK